MHFLHDYGLCHTSVKADNILETSNGYVLSDYGKYYMYNNGTARSLGLEIPNESTTKLKPFFQYKTDFNKLGNVLQYYLQSSVIKNPNDYIPIINELKNADDNFNVFNFLLKYNNIFNPPIITVNVILNKEFYKLAYYEYPIISDISSYSEFVNVVGNIQADGDDSDDNIKYYLSVCFLNKVSQNGRIEITDEEFKKVKNLFIEAMLRKDKYQNESILSYTLAINVFDEMFKDRYIEEVNLKNSIYKK